MVDLRDRARRASGFSLIEVLGAVAILGIWYVMLAALAMQGMQTIGESQRRLRASLLADEILSEYEMLASQEGAIEVFSEEREEGLFTVVVEVVDLSTQEDEILLGSNNAEAGHAPDLLQFLAEQSESPFAEFRDNNWILSYLREVHVEVIWQEGPNELTIHRTAYLWDAETWRVEIWGEEFANRHREKEEG